jgi:triacylglycerol esterase/lipase EstA (alpha/beta hydrolase family)
MEVAMMFHRIVSLAGCLAVIAAATAPTAAAAPEPGPPLTTPTGVLQQALSCNGDLSTAQRDPVLLVHGTFADSEINWNWNYKQALPARGEPTCTVDLPDRAAGDIQISTEYVVYAIRTMARESGRKVAIIGHSQGGLEARWALRWWPDIRHLVSDVILLATPNNGSAFTDGLCTSPGACAASLYQMRSDSAFLAALNRGRDAIGGVPYTSIVTNDDHVFVLPDQGMLDAKGAQVSNVSVQQLCPDHHFNPPELAHVSLAFDGPTYAIVVDALDHRGPATLSRIDAQSACSQATMPEVTLDEAYAKVADYATTLNYLLGPDGPKAPGEPSLACYATNTCHRP